VSEDPKSNDAPEKREESATAARREEGLGDLEALQQEVEKRIRDNRRFLERFLDDDFDEDEDGDEGDEGEEIFEEL